MKRPDFSGFEYSTILCLDNPHREFHPQGASVIPGSFKIPMTDDGRNGLFISHEMKIEKSWFNVSVIGNEEVETGIDLSEYEVIVCMGRGIGKNPTAGIELGLKLVDMFENAALGITRGIVTSSYKFESRVEQYTKEERQIGETGQWIKPKLYIGAGVSGAIQHKVGMTESEIVIAINENENADIRDFADYFINGDLFEVIPKMIESLSSMNGNLEEFVKGEIK
jgi:electron transfer flavoprotein alpha subunit